MPKWYKSWTMVKYRSTIRPTINVPKTNPIHGMSFGLASARIAFYPTFNIWTLLSSSLPVRQFGLFGAMSVIAANALMLLWFPPLLSTIGLAKQYSCNKAVPRRRGGGGWRILAMATQKFRWPVASIAIPKEREIVFWHRATIAVLWVRSIGVIITNL